jgi:organic radical activating enzyme
MNLMTISPVHSCDYGCVACPSKRWLRPVNDPYNKVKVEDITRYLTAHCPPDEWYIEITGNGEPGMYYGIGELVTRLDRAGYIGLIKTNGSRPIPKTNGFKRVAAWHAGKPIPLYYDTVLIIDGNPKDSTAGKMRYLEQNSIPYKRVPFRDYRVPAGEREETAWNKAKPIELIDNWCVMYASGNLQGCYKHDETDELSIYKNTPPPFWRVKYFCPLCPNVQGFEMFFKEI